LHLRYAALWAAGAADSDEMEQLLAELVTWWRDVGGGDPGLDPDLAGLINGLGPPLQIPCDPQLAAFVARLERTVRG
jgi:hypothetical protein